MSLTSALTDRVGKGCPFAFLSFRPGGPAVFPARGSPRYMCIPNWRWWDPARDCPSTTLKGRAHTGLRGVTSGVQYRSRTHQDEDGNENGEDGDRCDVLEVDLAECAGKERVAGGER